MKSPRLHLLVGIPVKVVVRVINQTYFLIVLHWATLVPSQKPVSPVSSATPTILILRALQCRVTGVDLAALDARGRGPLNTLQEVESFLPHTVFRDLPFFGPLGRALVRRVAPLVARVTAHLVLLAAPCLLVADGPRSVVSEDRHIRKT